MDLMIADEVRLGEEEELPSPATNDAGTESEIVSSKRATR